MNEDGNRIKPTPEKVHMGTKLLKKGHKAKSSTIKSQGHCTSTSPLNSIRENGEIVEVEEQMPELVDISDDGDTNGDRQPLITFGQMRLTNMGDTTENLSQGVNVTFEVDKWKYRSFQRYPSKPTCTLEKSEKSAKEIVLTLSDKLCRNSLSDTVHIRLGALYRVNKKMGITN